MCKTSSSSSPDEQLPIIIAGAGPCGLVAALTLQRQGIPFIIYERATRAKLCSNAGSGIDMAPTAVNILENELNVDMDRAMRPYEYFYMADMTGRHVKTYRLKELKVTETRSFGFANRSELQHALLDTLGLFDEEQDVDGILHCGVSVTGYSQNEEEDFVTVSLSNGTSIKGSVLLACDGIHSGVRKHMHQHAAKDDLLHYCGQECWWGKTTIQPGSDLDKELKRIEMESDMEDGSVSLALLGTHKYPGTFFSCPGGTENVHAWCYFVKNKTPPTANATNDLTRRGGTILSTEEKRRELDAILDNRADLLRLIIEQTPAEDITRAGLFDRDNLDLPYVDGRVALLGDAAHPQSPMMGQGANMAIVDGYVVATRLAAANDIVQALQDYDCDERRKANNGVIKEARKYGKIVCSNSRFTCWASKAVIKHLPAKLMLSQLIKGDKSNKDFVDNMNEEIKTVTAVSAS